MSFAIVGCACQSTQKNTNTNDTNIEDVMVGAYSEYRELQDDELSLFESVYQGDIALTPKSVATQVVAGTNYRYRCSDAAGAEYIVTVFVPLPCYQDEQQTEVTNIEKVE